MFADAKTCVVETVSVREVAGGLEMTVKDHYENFAGSVCWIIEKQGMGDTRYDCVYTGDNLDSREVGMRTGPPAARDEIKWRRWSEWGLFPEDCLCRTRERVKSLYSATGRRRLIPKCYCGCCWWVICKGSRANVVCSRSKGVNMDYHRLIRCLRGESGQSYQLSFCAMIDPQRSGYVMLDSWPSRLHFR